MLATRVRQKDSTFYFVSYKAQDLLGKVRFVSRYYFEGETIGGGAVAADDPIAHFIEQVEHSEKAFQRVMNRRKIRDIVNFYEQAETQPAIPGTVLLFTEEALAFEPLGKYEALGNLTEPTAPFLVIDGQHRLAGLRFFREKNAALADSIEVPCVIFDGKTADFAAEMFVTINSTHTRINKSQLVDLLETVTWATPDRKFCARLARLLYEAEDSPLRYKINMLGGRSRQEKWILQAELYNELHRLAQSQGRFFRSQFGMGHQKAYPLFRDYLKGVSAVCGDAWGNNDKYQITRSVTLKAFVRVLGDLLKDGKAYKTWDKHRDPKVFADALSAWKELIPRFRADGFYERFPAKGQVERVRRIHQELTRALGLAAQPADPGL